MDNLFYRKRKGRPDLRALLRKLLRNRRLMLALVIAVPLAGVVIFGNHGILQRIRLERRKTELQEQIRSEESERKALEEESKKLDTDRAEIEKVAREKHHMARDGEQVYRVTPAK
ncbi:MAG TPA: septum formation initiator family protein [Bacteroidota bacterium]|nr:septum formation initiator family protein [Bacteroidota bacterium]